MSEKQWYRLLLEDNCTMEESMEHERRYFMCRVELANPDTDWERSWMLARLPGLEPENVSFIFKMMHQIRPIHERVARTSPRSSPESEKSQTFLGTIFCLCKPSSLLRYVHILLKT